MRQSQPTRLALLLSGLVILTLLSGGCGRGGQATPTPTKTPTIPTAIADTPTPLPALPTDTPTPPPTATPTLPPPTDTPPPPTPTPTPTPPLAARAANENPLTGLSVSDPASLQRRPLFVVINNDPPAREVHYGLPQADLVYEYLMEGRAVTRFTAVYLGSEATQIGPIRSARLINFYLTPQFGGALVASGAGQDVRWFLKHQMAAPYLDIDLDDPGNNVYSFSIGTDYRTRLQTTTELLRKWLREVDVEQAPQLRGFAFSESPAQGDSGQKVTIDFPAEVVWSYDAASRTYLRSMNGVAHLDAATGQQLSAANVILQAISHEPTEYVEDSLGTTSIRIMAVGEGAVTILRDGLSYTGTWQAGEFTMPEWSDEAGNPIPLRPGNTWVEVLEPTMFFAVE